jgi:hypothetical protein
MRPQKEKGSGGCSNHRNKSNSNGFAFFVWQKIEFANSQINMGRRKKRLSPTVWQN